jgi:hypothetical protein
MPSQRLTLLALLATTAHAAAPTTVLGFPEQSPHQDLQILGQSGDSVTYKVAIDQKETWTVTYSPQKIVGHGELEVSQGAKDIVDRSCDVVKGSVLVACAQSLSGTGLTPEDEQQFAEMNRLGSQPIPTEGPEAVALIPLTVGADAGGAAPGAVPGGPAGPEATGRPVAGPSAGEGPSSGPSAGEGPSSGPSAGKGDGPGAGKGEGTGAGKGDGSHKKDKGGDSSKPFPPRTIPRSKGADVL